MDKRSHLHKKPDSSASFPVLSQFQSRPNISQAKPPSQKPLTQTQTENQEFQQQKFEATQLKLQAKYGTITPQGQEHLTLLQAKIDAFRRDRLNSIPEHSLLDIPHLFAPRETPQPIQPKLKIGQVGDKYEREADRVAAQVVRQINAPQPQESAQGEALQRQQMPDDNEQQHKQAEAGIIQREQMPDDEEELQMKSMVQRQFGEGEMAATPDLESSIKQAKGSGQSLSPSIRQPMEQAFGADFSGVKVHTDAQSNQLNQSIQAKAFATGQDIFFRQGAYDPGSRAGQELLAHELTHVIQQNGSAVQAKPDMLLQKEGKGKKKEEGLNMKKLTTEGTKRRKTAKEQQQQDGSEKIIQCETEELIQLAFEDDRQYLINTRDSLPQTEEASLYRQLLEEVIRASDLVRAVNYVPTSGNVVRRFAADGQVAGYVLNYQGQVDDLAERIGNLVHELTHITVQESFNADFVNYANPSTRAIPDMNFGNPDRAGADVGGFEQEVRGILNEEERQRSRMVDEANGVLIGNLNALMPLVDSTEMTDDQKNKVRDKLQYGLPRPHIEYDTVLNQIYVWCQAWNVNKQSDFYRQLENMVRDAKNRRDHREAIARMVNERSRSCCYIM